MSLTSPNQILLSPSFKQSSFHFYDSLDSSDFISPNSYRGLGSTQKKKNQIRLRETHWSESGESQGQLWEKRERDVKKLNFEDKEV